MANVVAVAAAVPSPSIALCWGVLHTGPGQESYSDCVGLVVVVVVVVVVVWITFQ